MVEVPLEAMEELRGLLVFGFFMTILLLVILVLEDKVK